MKLEKLPKVLKVLLHRQGQLCSAGTEFTRMWWNEVDNDFKAEIRLARLQMNLWFLCTDMGGCDGIDKVSNEFKVDVLG